MTLLLPAPSWGQVSDDFLGSALDTSRWTFVNPRNDATATVADGALRIAVPGGGLGHDVWTGGNFAPRVMQAVADGDFEMSARFLSNVTKKYQMQGFIVEQSPGNHLRLDIHSTGTQVQVFAASFVNGTPTTRVNQTIPSNAAGYYLRVVRAGNQWTLAYSANGTNWTVAVSFAHVLAVNQAGVFAGNAQGSTSPAFTAVVDYVMNSALPPPPDVAGPEQPFISDDFSGPWNASVWTLVNPRGDAALNLEGNALWLQVPGGVAHEAWTAGNQAPRIMQTVGDADLDLEAKFLLPVEATLQTQGFVIEQDAANFLRLDIHRNDLGTRILAGSLVNNVPTTHTNLLLTIGSPVYLRLIRQEDQWSYFYSGNGINWQLAVSFTHPMVVAKAGVFAGNGTGAASPEFTSVIDYVFNNDERIVPEDGGLHSLVIDQIGAGEVQRNPLAAGYVEYALVELTAVPAIGWQFLGWSGALDEATNPVAVPVHPAEPRLTANFGQPDITGQVFQIWYGDHQVFGAVGVPQPQINVLGNVTAPPGLYLQRLSWRLNGQDMGRLSVGTAQNERLGIDDFNVEIFPDQLLPGVNSVLLVAHFNNGAVYFREVTVEQQTANVWPLPYAINWSTTTEISDVAQVVDGNWVIEGDKVRSIEPQFDRLIAIGDILWTDYEITVPVTVNSYLVNPGNAALVGVILRWDGHDAIGQEQPGTKWWPLGAMGIYRWYTDSLGPRFQIYENTGAVRINEPTGKKMPLGVEHVFKMRVETVPGQSFGKYSFKAWPAGTPEPAAWDMVRQATSGLQNGSATLVSHFADASFGPVTITPLP